MAVKALRLLQPAKGANEGDGNGSGHFVRHKKAQRQDTVTNTVVTMSVVIPPEMMECLNKTERRQIKLLLGKTKGHYTISMGGAAKGSDQRQGARVCSRNCQQP
jgi:hypothetical protein